MKRANGQGSIEKRKGRSKPWAARATTGWENGKQKKVLIGYFATKKEAQAALNKVTKSGLSKVSGLYSATVSDLFSRYMDFKKATVSGRDGVSEKTFQSYENGYRRIEPIHSRSLRSLTVDEIQHVINEIVEAGYSKSSINNARMVLNQLYLYAIPRGAADNNLMPYISIRLPKSSPTMRFSSGELETLWANRNFPGVDVTLSMIYTATRPAELLGLQINKFFPEESIVIGGIKTDAGKNRIIPIHHRILPFFLSNVGNRKDGNIFLNEFGRPLTVNYFSKQVFRSIKESLKLNDELTPRSCRKTGISLMVETKGISADVRTQIAGHADVRVEEEHYIEVEGRKLCEAINRIRI